MGFKKIVIIGLGLMGGSLAAACRERFPRARITGISRSREALALALRKRWVHDVTRDVKAGACDADLVVICTPVGTYLPYLKAIDRVCAKEALVMDVGSVKASVLREVNARKWRRLSFVGCHPMVGSHRRGIGAVDPALYKNGLVLLTPDRRTCRAAFRRAQQFWKTLSAKLSVIAPDEHDRLVGEVSHLPHALAVCLMHAVSAPALKVASTGFRDTTRIAAAASSIWQPIFSMNRKVMLTVLDRFERELRIFKKLLRGKNPSKLIRFLDQAQLRRSRL